MSLCEYVLPGVVNVERHLNTNEEKTIKTFQITFNLQCKSGSRGSKIWRLKLVLWDADLHCGNTVRCGNTGGPSVVCVYCVYDYTNGAVKHIK